MKNLTKILKYDEEKRLVFGWANVAFRVDGQQVEDLQEDMIDVDELESAAYGYVAEFGTAGEMHCRGNIGTLVESVVFTEEKANAMGVPKGFLPVGGWWVGFLVEDEGVWGKVKDGTYTMFSIEGVARREKKEG